MKYKVLILLLVTPFLCLHAQKRDGNKYLKPSIHKKRVTLIISGKERHYYSLSAKDTTVVFLHGNGIMKVMTRPRLKPGVDSKVKYEILFSVDGGPWQKQKFKGVPRAANATFKNGKLGVPGQRNDFQIELTRGYHSVALLLAKKEPKVEARFKFLTKKPKKRDWIEFLPSPPLNHVELVAREEIVDYYRFSKQKPLKVTLNGPTLLRVFTRIENHYNMKGRIHYRIQVKRDGKTVNTFRLSSVRSEITYYKSDKTLVPGKAREFVIDVPKGRHTYEIYPLDKSSVLGRLLIPKNAVSLEK
jgi:hypothetical protein